MIPNLVNFPLKNAAVFNEGKYKMRLHPLSDVKVTSLVYSNISFYHIKSPTVYSIHPNPDYGFIIMDEQNNILMVENEIECLEIPFITVVEVIKNAAGELPTQQVVFYIREFGCIFFESYAVYNISKPAMDYYLEMNKERRRNAKILK